MSDARNEQEKKALHLKRVSKELATTESSYINNLQQMIATYDEILKNPKIDKKQKAIIENYLGYYRTIVSTSQSLAKSGAFNIGAVKDEELNNVTPHQALETFEKLFNRIVLNKEVFNAYAHIVGENDIMVESFQELDKQLPEGQKFQDVLQQKFPLNTQALGALLIMPVQRVPRYKLLSEEFFKKAELENFHAKAGMLAAETKKLADQINEAGAFGNGLRGAGLTSAQSFELAAQLKDIPKLRTTFQDVSVDKFKILDAQKLLSGFVTALQQDASNKNAKLIELMQKRSESLTEAHANAFSNKPTTLTLKQMQQQLRDIHSQVQKNAVSKEMQKTKADVMLQLSQLESAITKEIKANPKSANATMAQTAYIEARKQSEPLLLAKKHINNNGKSAGVDIMLPLIEAMQKRKERKWEPLIAQMRAQVMKPGFDLNAAKRILQTLSDSKNIKSDSLRELIAERKEFVDTFERQLQSAPMQDFKAAQEATKVAKTDMSALKRHAGTRNLKQAIQDPAPTSSQARVLSQQQKANLVAARRKFGTDLVQNRQSPVQKVATAAATQPVKPTQPPKAAPPVPQQSAKPTLRTNLQPQQPMTRTDSFNRIMAERRAKSAMAHPAAKGPVQVQAKVDAKTKQAAPPMPPMGAKMSKRMTFFSEQHKQGVSQPKTMVKKEPPEWPTPKKGPGRT